MAPGHEDKLCCSPNRVGHMRIIRTCLHGETALLHQRSLLQPRQANHVQWSVMAISHVCNNVYRDQSSLPRAEACALHRKAVTYKQRRMTHPQRACKLALETTCFTSADQRTAFLEPFGCRPPQQQLHKTRLYQAIHSEFPLTPWPLRHPHSRGSHPTLVDSASPGSSRADGHATLVWASAGRRSPKPTT